MMKRVSRIFLTGLGTVLPLALTIYLLYWLATSTESLLGKGIRLFIDETYYRPGMGIVLGLIVFFVIGLLMKSWLVRRIFDWWNGLFLRLPLVKTIYRVFQDFVAFVTEPKQQEGQQVVAMQVGNTNMRVLGFVTRDDLKNLPKGLRSDSEVAVYLPFSYQIGGYTVFVPRDSLTPVDMNLQDAMRFAVTAGLSTEHVAEDAVINPARSKE